MKWMHKGGKPLPFGCNAMLGGAEWRWYYKLEFISLRKMVGYNFPWGL